MVGLRFGRLVIQAKRPRSTWKTRNAEWSCLCDCGNTHVAQASNLKSGHTKSCGCYARELYGTNNRRHGMYASPEYNAWERMIQRCTNLKCEGFENYGGRGIRVCLEWLQDFEAFYRDMGPRPSARHSIDRINVDGDYEPSNCKWATHKQQARNRRNNRFVLCNGRLMCLTEAAEVTGINRKTLSTRLSRGWSGARLFAMPKSCAEAGE